MGKCSWTFKEFRSTVSNEKRTRRVNTRYTKLPGEVSSSPPPLLTCQTQKKKKGRPHNKAQHVKPTIEKEILSELKTIEIPSEINPLPISLCLTSLPLTSPPPIETKIEIESSPVSSPATSFPPLIHPQFHHLTTSDIPHIPPISIFSLDSIDKFIGGKQNFRKGLRLVSCGDVHQLKRVDQNWQGVVHAEKTANLNYIVSCSFSMNEVSSSRCTCKAKRNIHNKCKHVSALLCSLFSLRNHYTQQPKWAIRKSLWHCRHADPSSQLYKVAKVGLKWKDVIDGFFSTPPRHNGKLPVIKID